MSVSVSSPLLKRLPPGLWTAGAWLVAAVYPLVEYVVLPHGPEYSLSYPEDGLDASLAKALLALAFALALTGSALLRRAPSPAYALVLAGTVVSTAAWRQDEIPPLQFLATGAVLAYVAAVRSRRASLTAATGTLAVLACYYLLRPLLGDDSGVAPEPFLALTAALAWLIGHTVHQARAHREELYARAAVQAVTAERLRIAREMHDTVAHSIGIIALQAGAAARVVGSRPDSAREAMLVVEQAGRETLAGLRRTLGALRQDDGEQADREGVFGSQERGRGTYEERVSAPGAASPRPDAAPPPSRPAPGLADVPGLAATAEAAGVRVDVSWHGTPRRLPTDIDLAAFRIVQESVTNVVRHAGVAACRVRLDHREDALAIEVADRGRGGAGATSGGTGAGTGEGYGLLGMGERVALLHGTFTAGPRPGGGFRVAAVLPLPAPAVAAAR
ncbi:sensor histidine kinase [Streptomyces sp. P6-2-1]|uniref:sensor histidine kinase n=1 Tax=Streptomyces sp. P6-2-1 TaxID=3422591 RepID=UPI003D35EC64